MTSLKFASKINSLCLNELTNCPIAIIFIYPVVCYRQTDSLTVRPDMARWIAISMTITVNRRIQRWPNIRPDLRTRLVISDVRFFG